MSVLPNYTAHNIFWFSQSSKHCLLSDDVIYYYKDCYSSPLCNMKHYLGAWKPICFSFLSIWWISVIKEHLQTTYFIAKYVTNLYWVQCMKYWAKIIFNGYHCLKLFRYTDLVLWFGPSFYIHQASKYFLGHPLNGPEHSKFVWLVYTHTVMNDTYISIHYLVFIQCFTVNLK